MLFSSKLRFRLAILCFKMCAKPAKIGRGKKNMALHYNMGKQNLPTYLHTYQPASTLRATHSIFFRPPQESTASINSSIVRREKRLSHLKMGSKISCKQRQTCSHLYILKYAHISQLLIQRKLQVWRWSWLVGCLNGLICFGGRKGRSKRRRRNERMQLEQ